MKPSRAIAPMASLGVLRMVADHSHPVTMINGHPLTSSVAPDCSRPPDDARPTFVGRARLRLWPSGRHAHQRSCCSGSGRASGILYQGPTHGFAVAARLKPDGDIGRVWSLSRPLTYRSLDAADLRGARPPDRRGAGHRRRQPHHPRRHPPGPGRAAQVAGARRSPTSATCAASCSSSWCIAEQCGIDVPTMLVAPARRGSPRSPRPSTPQVGGGSADDVVDAVAQRVLGGRAALRRQPCSPMVRRP